MQDLVILGGGPAGLSAALQLGRARRPLTMCDAGTPRNARASHVNGFLTRDGTPPHEMRALARAQLAKYPNVSFRAGAALAISGEKDNFTVHFEDGELRARRLLLATGMVDVLPDLPGAAELWGHAIFQCPYCHAWEVQDRPFGVLASHPMMIEFSLLLTCWTRDIVLFTNNAFPVPAELRTRLDAAHIVIEERPVLALRANGTALSAVAVEGAEIPREYLFMRPKQELPPLVASLHLSLTEPGFLLVDDFQQTSRPGIYAAGDLCTPMQNAIGAAAAGAKAAATLNHSFL